MNGLNKKFEKKFVPIACLPVIYPYLYFDLEIIDPTLKEKYYKTIEDLKYLFDLPEYSIRNNPNHKIILINKKEEGNNYYDLIDNSIAALMTKIEQEKATEAGLIYLTSRIIKTNDNNEYTTVEYIELTKEQREKFYKHHHIILVFNLKKDEIYPYSVVQMPESITNDLIQTLNFFVDTYQNYLKQKELEK